MRARPLGALLAVRKHAEEEARASLDHAISAQADAARRYEAIGRLAGAHARYRAEARLRLASPPASAAALQAASRFAERLRGEARAMDAAVRASENALVEAEVGVERRRELLGAARLGVRGVERHRRRWDEARRRELDRRAESDAEDGVSARAAARSRVPARTRS